MPYYVVKKYEPNEIFGSIVTALVIIGLIVILTIYIGLIFLAIIAAIAAGVGFIYALVIYIKALINNLKMVTTKPRDIKEFYYYWHQIVISTSKEAFQANLSTAGALANRSRILRNLNPAKYFMLFLSLFLIVVGALFIVLLGALQYFLMLAIIVLILLAFVLMVLASIIVSFFFSFGFGLKYLYNSLVSYKQFSIIKISTYSYFKYMGGEIKDYWRSFADVIKGMSSDMKSHAQRQWGSVASYVIYSPVKYYLIASPITLFFNIGVVTLLHTIFSSLLFIILLILKVVCCLITVIMKH